MSLHLTESFNCEHSKLDIFSCWMNAGLNKGVNSLREFIGLSTELSEPECSLLETDNIVYGERRIGEPSICLLQSMQGVVDGFLLFSISNEALVKIMKQIRKENLLFADLPDYVLTQSILNECANVFAGNMLSTINYVDLDPLHLTPGEQTYDLTGAALEFIACQMGMASSCAAVCSSSIYINELKESIHVWIIVNPECELLNGAGRIQQ